MVWKWLTSSLPRCGIREWIHSDNGEKNTTGLVKALWMVELLYNNIYKMRHRKEKLTYHPMIQTDLSTLSPEHVHTLASLSYHYSHYNRAKKIISDPFTRLTPFSTDSPLEHATDHCPLIQLLSMCVYGMYTYAITYVYIFPMPSTVSVRTQAP